MSVFYLHSWNMFLLDIEFWVNRSFLLALLRVLCHFPLASWLPIRNLVVQLVVPLLRMPWLFLWLISRFSLHLWFFAVWLWCVWAWISLRSFVWGLLSFLNLVFHQIWDIISHYFFKYIFCSTLSPLFWDSGDINRYCPTILFSVLFLSVLKSDHFYLSVIKFTDFLLSSPFCYRAHPVSFLFWLLCF